MTEDLAEAVHRVMMQATGCKPNTEPQLSK